MGRVLAAVQRISRYGLWFGGGLILLAAILIGIDVLLRKFFDRSIGGADELSGYAMAIGAVWAMPATLLERGHIRIDSLYTHFNLTVRVWIDLLGLAMFIAFFGLIAWHGYGVMQQSWSAGSRSQSALETPLVIPQALWVLGLISFVLIGLLLMLRAFLLFLHGDRAAAVRLIGTRSAEEEVEAELQDMRDHTEMVQPS